MMIIIIIIIIITAAAAVEPLLPVKMELQYRLKPAFHRCNCLLTYILTK